MVMDTELIARINDFLSQADLDNTTTAIVRRRLEQDFGIDLSDRKKFIREQVDLYLERQLENVEVKERKEEEEEQGDGEVDDDRMEMVKSEETATSDVDQDEDEEPSTSNKRSRRESSEGKKRGGGFTKLCSLSPQLQKLVGAPTLARTEVVKQIWAYIREKKLQDPANKKSIICDKMLHSLFEVKSIDMFQMNKALTKHIWPLDSDGAVPTKSTDEEKQHKKEKQEDLEEPKRKEKKQKVGGGGKSGFLAPLQLSDALVKFLGTGESEMPRSDVIKRMWDYIKGNNLQFQSWVKDPTDKRRIICDEKLKELFNVDSFVGFTVSKLLVDHFIKA